MILLALWLGCTDPVPLPQPMATTPAASGRMLQHGEIRGYISRPSQGTPHTGVLLLVERIDASSQTQADTRAAQGTIVLTIEPTTSTQGAKRYLLQLPGIQTVSEECRRSACP